MISFLQERTLLQTQVSKIEHDKRRLSSRVDDLKASADAHEDAKVEKERLNSRLEEMAKEAEELRSFKEAQEKAVENFDKVRNGFVVSARALALFHEWWPSSESKHKR